MKSRGTLADVLSFYDAYAPAHGWSTAPGHKKLGYSSFWEKTLPDGVKAALSLFYGGSALSTPDQQAPSYELVGSVSAKL